MKRKMMSYVMGAVLALSPTLTLHAKETTIQKTNQTTVITSPIDSRPISSDYLQNLIHLGGDRYLSVSNELLDFYSDTQMHLNKKGQSSLIRKDIFQKVKEHNNPETTVILNTSSYINGGLVNGRHINAYRDYKEALSELELLTTTFSEPTYYVHANMPRNLPETRNHVIWPNDIKQFGLGHFYLLNHPELDLQSKTYIQNNFSQVSPSQLLVEWGYVESKKYEMGELSLSQTEQDFLNYFHENFLKDPTYQPYVLDYQMLFEYAANLMKDLLLLSSNNLIDELVLSTDDYQLPQFILYLSKQNHLDNTWIFRDNKNQVIKYSFSKMYLESHTDSVYNYHKTLFGEDHFKDALKGLNEKVNYIYGTDEIPQMLYARDYSKRKGLTTQFLTPVFDYNYNKDYAMHNTGDYDVLSTKDLIDQRINFVSNKSKLGYHHAISVNPTAKPMKIYISKYVDESYQLNKDTYKYLIQDMFNSFNAGFNIGLIELYKPNSNVISVNPVLDLLLDRNYLDSIGLVTNGFNQLATYSSWNTDGNAIGLAIAQAQIFGIVDQNLNDLRDQKEIAEKQAIILSQHLLEDGIYGAKLKNNPLISYQFDYNALFNHSVLLNQLNSYNALNCFTNSNTPLFIQNTPVVFNRAEIESASFPWLRRYEIKIKTKFY